MNMITLLTDFGVEDEYVGVCKGVILGINPDALIVDLSHGIPPQNVLAAAYTLKHAYTYFPKGSIHVAVVDPGVGSARRLLALRKEGHLFLAPDNGLLVPIIGPGQNSDIRSIENEALFLKTTSATFHGRDIFAPVAAHMSRGYPFSKLGPALHANALTPLHHRESKITLDGGVEGTIVSVDRFGNLITNIEAGLISELGIHNAQTTVCVEVGGGVIEKISRHYAEGRQGHPMALIGSRSCLEIAVNKGSAANLLAVGAGECVTVRKKEHRTEP